jgi:membrane protease YdiL (CAAX protease family)
MTIIPFVYCALVFPPLLGGGWALHVEDPLGAALIAANGFAAGIVEELVFRGLMLGVLRQSAPSWSRRGIYFSALLFSVPHALNVLAGAQPLRVAAQLSWALLFGIMVAELRIAGRSVWPVAILHGALNAIVHLNGISAPPIGPATAIFLAIAPLPLNLYSYLLFRSRLPVGEGGSDGSH